MPERYVEYGQMWKDLNPDAELHDWTEEEIFDTEWINQRVLDKMRSESKRDGADLTAYYTHVADVVDYELCYTFGGWYFNTDLKPLKPLDTLGQDEKVPAFAMEDDHHAVNMAMYSPENNRLFELIIGNLPLRYFGMPGAFMNATTGVQLIMHCLGMYNGKYKLYHRNVFNPTHWSEVNYGEYPDEKKYGPETVAVHEWLHRTNQRGQRILEV